MIWWDPTGCWPTVTHTLQSSLDIHMRLSTALGSAAFTLECRLKLESLRSSRARDPRQLVEMSPKWLQTKDVQPETSEAVTLPDAQSGAAIFQQIDANSMWQVLRLLHEFPSVPTWETKFTTSGHWGCDPRLPLFESLGALHFHEAR